MLALLDAGYELDANESKQAHCIHEMHNGLSMDLACTCIAKLAIDRPAI